MNPRSLLLLLTLPLSLVLAACGSSLGDGNAGGPPGPNGPSRGGATIPSVEAVQARYGALPLEERMSGTVQARNQVAIYPEIDAPVETVVAQNGDYVQEGDVLVRLRDDQYRERVATG